jgi:thymidylate synthase ThyX
MSKLITRPEVFLAGETKLLEDGVFDYLRASGNTDFIATINEARMGGASDAQIMCSMFAKICYASLVMGKNDNLTRIRSIQDNFKSVLATGHGSILEHIQFNFIVHNCSRVFCYHPNTEVFTLENGWVPVTELTTDMKLLTLNPETKQAEFSCPESVHEFDYTGELVGWSTSQMVSPLVTPDHLLWAAPYDLRRARGLSNEENIRQHAGKIPANELVGKRFAIQHDVLMTPVENIEANLTFETELESYSYNREDLAVWLGWVASDGHFSKDRPNEVRISQSKPHNVKHLRGLMSHLFGNRWREHGPYKEDGSIYFVINDAGLARWAINLIGPDKQNRRIHSNLLCWPDSMVASFLAGLMGGDGSVHEDNGHEVLYTPSKFAAGQYQYLFARLGMASNVREDDRRGDSHEINGVACVSKLIGYILSVSRKSASLVKQEHQSQVPYSGKVYCPKTKHGLIYVRRQGLAFWCGNTHELIRHRVGTAFSQTSGRYVRSDQVSLVLDPILNPVIDEIQSVLEFIEAKYAQMVDKLAVNQQDMHTKKKMTSALRRIMPNGQANEMAVSLNLRSLRHTIMMRTAAGAEWEIREVYGQIYRIMKGRYPELFQDACEREVDGALEVYGMKMQPYEMALDSYSEAELRSAVALKTIQKVM